MGKRKVESDLALPLTDVPNTENKKHGVAISYSVKYVKGMHFEQKPY